MTEQDIRNNPSIIMFDEENISEELKMVAIEMKPNLLEILSNKTDALIIKSFEGGHWSDTIIANLDKCIADENSVAKFMETAPEVIAEEFLGMFKGKLNSEASKQLLLRFPNLAGKATLTDSDNMDWEIINNTLYMDAKTVNPLLSMKNLTVNKVEALYKNVGKWAVLGIPQEFQTKEIKEDILKKNPYDFCFVAFDEEIAKLFIGFPGNIVEYAMTRKKNDPYYDLRVLHILNILGSALQWVDKQTEEMQITAIKNNPMAIEYVSKQTDDLCLLALKLDPAVISVIEKPSKAVCAFAGIPYVKPSKYTATSSYLVTMEKDDVVFYQVMQGDKVDSFLELPLPVIGGKMKKIAKVKEISDIEIKMLDKFHIFRDENPFLREPKKEETENVEGTDSATPKPKRGRKKKTEVQEADNAEVKEEAKEGI